MLQIYRPTPPVQWDWLVLRGPDSGDFLHRLTTVHVRSLGDGQGAPGFFLSPQGKIRAYFRLWKISGEAFFFEYNAGTAGRWKQALKDVIEEFHFGEKFTVESAPEENAELVCAWLLGDEASKIAETGRTREIEPGIRVFGHGSVDYGTPWVSAWGAQAKLESWVKGLGAQSIGFEKIERMRISQARPWVDTELSNETIPLDAGLREAISENKGCYPGQEVIEKIISLGSPARRLARIEGKGPAPAPGQGIFAATNEIGKITSVVATEDGFEALGFIRKTHARPGVEVAFATPGANTAASSARITFVPEYKPENKKDEK